MRGRRRESRPRQLASVAVPVTADGRPVQRRRGDARLLESTAAHGRVDDVVDRNIRNVVFLKQMSLFGSSKKLYVLRCHGEQYTNCFTLFIWDHAGNL